jgi:very-short-patch-repair endonuclease
VQRWGESGLAYVLSVSVAKSDGKSARAWDLARKQHWVLARRQLLELGFTEAAIEHRLASGRLRKVMRGVYGVGRPGMSPQARWMAALLACGEKAVLSHRSAAALWGMAREPTRVIDVSVRRRCEHRLEGIRARSRPSLPAEDVTEFQGIPITTPARTLVDLASEPGRRDLERCVNEADKHDLIDPETLRAVLERFQGEPGVRVLRALLDRQSFALSDSNLEIFFRRIARAVGLPPPRSKEWVNNFEVDFFWPDFELVVETDGLRYHRTPGEQARDRLRDQTHTAAGMTHLRFTHYQIRYEPNYVSEVLRKVARRWKR